MITFDPTTHTYALDGKQLPSVTEVLRSVGIIDTAWCDQWSRDKGSKLHRALELYDADGLDEEMLDPELAPYLVQWKAFLAASRAKITGVEQVIANALHGYAGMLDRRLLLYGSQDAVLDIKTNTAPAWVGLQLAAYAACLGPKVRRYSLALTKTGFKLREHTDRADWPRFLEALQQHKEICHAVGS